MDDEWGSMSEAEEQHGQLEQQQPTVDANQQCASQGADETTLGDNPPEREQEDAGNDTSGGSSNDTPQSNMGDPSMSWWIDDLLQGPFKDHRGSMRQSRPLRVGSACTGLWSEGMCMKAPLAMHWQNMYVATLAV
jgi:hypothetical protein